jgi:hypothetical protein
MVLSVLIQFFGDAQEPDGEKRWGVVAYLGGTALGDGCCIFRAVRASYHLSERLLLPYRANMYPGVCVLPQ